MFKLNKDLLVKTPTGFKSFSGIQKVYKPFYHWIIFEDGTEIKCSENHSFGSEKIKASTIKVDDVLQGKKIVYNEIVEEGIYLYDLLDVGEDNLYYSNNIVSHNCEFLGSVNTLISPAKLRNLVYDDPIKRNAGLDIYEEANEENNYLITVDVARGIGNDYSAFIVFDITNFPYKIVAKYKNNEIKPMMFPSIIHQVAKGYNDAWLLVEVNDIGDQVASILQYDLEYDNVLMCAMRGRAGQIVGSGFSGKKSQLGVRTTAAVKKLGCSNLKTLLEDDKLLVCDYDIIAELTTFSQRGNSFEAEEGCNDDLAMCLVIFSWLVAQDYFKEMTDNDVRKRIYEEQKNQIDQDMAPFGFISDGLDDGEIYIDEETGDRWLPFTSKEFGEYSEMARDGMEYNTNSDDWNLDEYGDKSYMWDYR
jgi:hypothetical protein